MAKKEKRIVITRYAKRNSLYNRAAHEYVNVDNIYALVREGKDVVILKQITEVDEVEKDETKNYFLSSLIEVEKEKSTVKDIPLLFRAIRAGGLCEYVKKLEARGTK